MEVNNLEIALSSLEEEKKTLLAEVNALDVAIKVLRSKLPKGNTTIAQNKEGSERAINTTSNYSANWTNRDKVLYFLKEKQRFLHFREIAAFINEAEGTSEDEKLLAGLLSSSCGSIKADGTIVKYQIGNSNQKTFWGSPKWLNETGEIKSGFEYDAGVLEKGNNSTKVEIEL